ncbi:MAG: leucine--tRNA ligase [Clostridia bacterium]
MYDKKIDKKWQEIWESKKCFHAEDCCDKKKFYSLIEFPYPSGAGLHVGHARAFMGIEVLSRMKRMKGYNVLFPIGFDAFGLPTENYAMKTGIHPRIVTDENIKTFTKQLKAVGLSFDFDRVIDTTDPEYFKWTQWIFLKLFEKGLAYKDKTYVNYCPKCRVILANEESQGGVCDRCDSKIIQMEKEVWMLKITDYADKLLEELDNLDFPERVKAEQENWIGRSCGAEVEFPIEGTGEKLKVYTTRPDTIFGVSFMVMAPEHKMLDKYANKIENFDEVLAYRKKALDKTEFERTKLVKEKTGVMLKGLTCINPVNNEKLPILIADYVMLGYGTGAIMAVPAHDDRDFDFAKKFNLPVKQVIGDGINSFKKELEKPYLEDGIIINSEFLNGLNTKDAQEKMLDYLTQNNIGVKKTNYHMKDWAFARQRYWGEPVPIIKCEHCGLVPMNVNDLPLTLPEVKDFMPGEDGMSPLAKVDSWVNTVCPKCGRDAKRETDTMPQWAGSSWYYLRYIDPHNISEFASQDKLKYWLPVDQYNGGMEHVTRHLIYSRFWHRFLYDIGLVPTKEPYAKRSTQGLILGPDGDKMSKSKGNVVNPDDIIKEFGADTLRTYILFIGDYSQSAPWSENGVKGAKKFLDRVMRLQDLATNEEILDKELDRQMNLMIKKVTSDYEEMKYNTAIACMMSYVNLLYKYDKVNIKYIKPLLQVLNPVAPHVTEELWEMLKFENYIFNSKWPEYDENKMVADEVEMALLVNSSVKFKFNIDSSLNEKQIEEYIKKDEKLLKYIPEGKQIRKVIVVKGRMINVVIG